MTAPRYREGDSIKPPYADARFSDTRENTYISSGTKQRTLATRILHSFKRREPAAYGIDEEDAFPRPGDTSQLHRKLQGRHLQMISVGGAIGAGLFIGSGKALATGGPGAVLLDFGLIGLMLFCTVNALGELATLFPVQGTYISDVTK